MASGTYIDPDRYSASLFIKWEIVPPIDTLEVSIQRSGKLHSEATVRVEEDGLLRTPILLSVATFVRDKWDHHSRILL